MFPFLKELGNVSCCTRDGTVGSVSQRSGSVWEETVERTQLVRIVCRADSLRHDVRSGLPTTVLWAGSR